MQKTTATNPLSSAYDPKEVEGRIYKVWEDSGYFNPDNLPGKRTEAYTIMIAPPNVTGALHMGHALENTLSDVLIRNHRMRGFKTLWLPGTDHAGIATQNVVEKNLKKQGLSRHDLGREKFIEKIWEWKKESGDYILKQMKQLGYSLDWSRTRFTMDEEYQKAVRTAFEKYYKEGLIYQGERVINWCIKDQTALSDLELEYVEEKSNIWYLKYPIKDTDKHVIVATTRPETMLGDTAVAVNPKDERYAGIVGKIILLPVVNREIPVIEDRSVEMEFGTGAVKVTPAHDISDSDIAERHKLPYIKVINEVGKVSGIGPEFDGLKILEAREKVVEKFKELGLLEKEEELVHNVAKCYRCGSTIEPLLSKQWFLKMKPFADKALKAINSGEVQYYPENWKGVAVNWLENVRDWCVSRQIWWGHPVPIEGSTDTFDTWFSAALWPFATLGWPEKTKDLKEFYPTSVILSARDILHLWISRMIFSGLEFMGEVPFKHVVTHATILTKDGKRMSKSLGTGIDPMDLIAKYGADATRFGLIYQALGGQDIRFNEDVLLMGKKFCNKLWNIARYVSLKAEEQLNIDTEVGLKEYANSCEEPINKDICNSLAETLGAVNKNLEGYEFGQAAHALYDFIWKEFADVYIEETKKSESEETKKTLVLCLLTILKMLHPMMPFVTEELWKHLKQKDLLIVAEWPR